MPGNQGLKDAAMALEWVAKEIHNFGGNPNLITVMGMSAGAVMSHFICTAARTKRETQLLMNSDYGTLPIIPESNIKSLSSLHFAPQSWSRGVYP